MVLGRFVGSIAGVVCIAIAWAWPHLLASPLFWVLAAATLPAGALFGYLVKYDLAFPRFIREVCLFLAPGALVGAIICFYGGLNSFGAPLMLWAVTCALAFGIAWRLSRRSESHEANELARAAYEAQLAAEARAEAIERANHPTCPGCGQRLSAGHKTCPWCGHVMPKPVEII